MFIKLMDLFAGLSNKSKFIVLILIDALILLLSIYIAISVRVGYFFYTSDVKYIFISIIAPFICIPIFYKAGLYSNVIRYINFNFILKIFIAIMLYCLFWGFIVLIIRPDSFPRSVIIINIFISLTLITNIRVLAKVFFDFNLNYLKTIKRNIIIYGINSEGIALFESIKNNKSFRVISFIDESSEFQNRYIYNIKVRSLEEIKDLNRKNKINDVFITKFIKSKNELNALSKICDQNNISIKTKTQDEWNNFVAKDTNINAFEKIEPSEFLKRNVVESDYFLLSKNISDKTVLITGAGGSIGSEITSQTLDLNPSSIILLEQNEYALFKIKEKLNKYNKNKIQIHSILGSTTNKKLIEEIMQKYNPFIIFHTAAYKHVGLVESNKIESFYNNVIGTYVLINACQNLKIKNFVNISTDKAVLPTTFMGVTKRISEMLIQVLSQQNSFTKFSIVRFGNVIGSSGSVIPIFQKQIKDGGPVTVTDPEVKRYFMSITEAAQLVMQSSSLGRNGNIFLLDMGKPIKIYELAKSMIKNYNNNNNYLNNKIDIIFTGLSQIEKLNEDLYYSSNKKESQHPKIFIDEENLKISPNFLDDFLYIYSNYSKISLNEIYHFLSKHINSFKR